MKKYNLDLGAQKGTLWIYFPLLRIENKVSQPVTEEYFPLLRIENKVSQPVTEDRGSNCRLGLDPKSTEQNH